MMMRGSGVAAAVAARLAAVLPAAGASAVTAYPNCTALHQKYPHGVGKKGARDLISGRYIAGRSVTTFKVSTTIYNANKGRDRDKDGVACEKR